MKILDVGLDQLLAKMERAMDAMSRRQQLTASNIANIDTPGYKTVDIDFWSALKGAVGATTESTTLRQSRPGHLGGSTTQSAARPEQVDSLPLRNDGNNVSLDREMLALAQTRQRYEVAAALARMRLRLIRSTISEGREG